jgi:hypothetical protein
MMMAIGTARSTHEILIREEKLPSFCSLTSIHCLESVNPIWVLQPPTGGGPKGAFLEHVFC